MLRKGGMVLLVAMCIASMFGYRTYSRHRDLAEILQWMKQTYNPYENGWGGHGTVVEECDAKCTDTEIGHALIFKETLSYEGCKLSTVTTTNRKEDRGLHETFNLGSIGFGVHPGIDQLPPR
jgi:hypothetical protein